ncbi:MAG: hypothetical protein ACQSGP_17540 [Frankia sp.]
MRIGELGGAVATWFRLPMGWHRAVPAISFATLTVATGALAWTTKGQLWPWQATALLVLAGAGHGAGYGALMQRTAGSVDAEHAASVSGVLSTINQLAIVSGIAGAGALYVAVAPTTMSLPPMAGVFAAIAAIQFLVGAVVCIVIARKPARQAKAAVTPSPGPAVPPDIRVVGWNGAARLLGINENVLRRVANRDESNFPAGRRDGQRRSWTAAELTAWEQTHPSRPTVQAPDQPSEDERPPDVVYSPSPEVSTPTARGASPARRRRRTIVAVGLPAIGIAAATTSFLSGAPPHLRSSQPSRPAAALSIQTVNPALEADLKGPRAGAVSVVGFSPNGRLLAVVGQDGNVILWNVADPNHPARIATLTGNSGKVNSLAFSPDGHTLAIGLTDGTVRLWKVG